MKIKEVTTASTDVLSMYHSIKFPLLKKEISHFTRKLSKNQKSTIELILKLTEFVMSLTLMIFREKYFEYGGKVIKSKGLEIGRY